MRNLRADDRAEVVALAGDVDEAAKALQQVDTFVGLENGEPVAVFGCSMLANGVGFPWFLGTDRSMAYPLALTREARSRVAEWHKRYPVLTGWVSAANTAHILWLRRLGFILTDYAENYAGSTVPFYQFTRVEPCVSRLRLSPSA